MPVVSQNGISSLGDDCQRMVAAGSGLQVATGDPGSAEIADIPSGNGTFAISANVANTGSAVAGASSVSNPKANPSAWDGGNYDIVFTAADAYEVRDGAGTVLDSGNYNASNGGSVTFRGAQVAFGGTPDARAPFSLGARTEEHTSE